MENNLYRKAKVTRSQELSYLLFDKIPVRLRNGKSMFDCLHDVDIHSLQSEYVSAYIQCSVQFWCVTYMSMFIWQWI